MRKFAAIVLALSTAAFASNTGIDPYEGDFTSPKTVSLPSMTTRSSCEAVGAYWRSDACYFNTSDDVSVYRGQEGYDIAVSTVGLDSQSCRFESTGSLQNDGTMLASLATAVGPCDVTLKYAGDNWISVRSSGACHSLCENESLSLDIKRAKRVDILGP